MKVHEYQAKTLLANSGVPLPKGRAVATAEDAEVVAQELGGPVVVKAQIHAGGRGKGGGIKLADTPEQVMEVAASLIGKPLVTHQTGPEGKLVHKVLVEEQIEAVKEFYLSILIDSSTGSPLVIASSAGGVEIEEVAERSPELIHRLRIDPLMGLQPYQARTLAFAIGLEGKLVGQAVRVISALYRAFIDNDCSLAEVNPLIASADGRMLALDAKLTFDDNAMFRHADILALRDLAEEDAMEVRAQKGGTNNYVKLDGNIGCIVNGAGLAMATMDAIKLAGGEPANFLDIGTVNNVDRVVNSIQLLCEDASVRAILVNIFGGMARVDIVAQGIIEAHRQIGMELPVVVRLAGTNLEEGERILRAAKDIQLIRATDLAEAAREAVSAAGENK